MAKSEIKTDFWVNDLLKEAHLNLTPQGSDIKEIENALKTASKSQTGKSGYPEFCGVVKDFLIVIEDKASVENHVKYDASRGIALDIKSTKDFAINGAIHYARHLAANTSFKKIFAFGISGNPKHHRITPIFVNERGDWEILNDVETFISFSPDNIDEYYLREVLKEDTNQEKETAEILKLAEELHNDLRTYGNLTNENKPLVVSGIMLALREIEQRSFSIDSLTGDSVNTDGNKILEAIKSNLKRAVVTPETKRDKILSQFSVIKDSALLNEINPVLGETPLKHL